MKLKIMGSYSLNLRLIKCNNRHITLIQIWSLRCKHSKYIANEETSVNDITSKYKERREICKRQRTFPDENNKKTICDQIPKKCQNNFRKTTFKFIKRVKTEKENAGSGRFRDQISTVDYADKENERRFNALGIQMLSRSLYRQLFGTKEQKASQEQVIRAQENLAAHGLKGKATTVVPDINTLCLPILKGGSVESHFQEIGEEQAGPYRTLLTKLVNMVPPKPPDEWSQHSGWTKYGPGTETKRVDFPDEDALVFDVEVCRSVGEVPTMATALSPTHWYSWVCHWLSEDGGNGDPGPPRQGRPITLEELIPLESSPSDSYYYNTVDKVRIVVAHHASYDRARVKEQYWPQGTGLRFFDTLSAHVCVGGVSSYQRSVLLTDEQRRRKCGGSKDSEIVTTSESEMDDQAWKEVASLNSLAEAHRLHCGGLPLDKTARDAFDPKSSPSNIVTRFQELMTYCSKDTKATQELLCALLPQFLERFPHPVTLAGMLELGTARLPVSISSWNQYLLDASETHDELESELKLKLIRKADEACRLAEFGEKAYQKDLWMWDQDWSIQPLAPKININAKNIKRVKKLECVSFDEGKLSDDDITEEEELLSHKFASLIQSSDRLPSRRPHLPGYPKWYRQLCPKPSPLYFSDEIQDDEWVLSPSLLTPNARVASKLFRLCWEKYPLHYVRGYGWGVLIPGRPILDNEVTSKNTGDCKPPLDELLQFCPIPNEVKSSFASVGSKTPSEVHILVEEYMSIREWVQKKKSLMDENEKLPAWYQGSGLLCPDVYFPGVWFCRLPHRDGPGKRVGNPLSKDFLEAASDETLSSDDTCESGLTARSALSIGKMVSYWRNNRDRISSQMVVQLPAKGKNAENSNEGFILPQLIVCGTLTRRAVEPTWMTASNAERDRIGSELRAIIRPSNIKQCIVGADVDSQELWIAALLGDAFHSFGGNINKPSNTAGLHGGTPLGWRTLQGQKSEGTDMHSATAVAVNCTRDQAKVLNYARIYGAGHRFATRLLQKFSPSLSAADASKKADTMMALTKGKKVYTKPKNDGLLEKRTKDGYMWEGGSESSMFNALEKIARMDYPETPFLRARLSKALEPERVGDRFLPTRINWVVQSGAVDFLHLLLVAMRSLSPGISANMPVSPSLRKKFDTRFALSFHDEVRYVVPSTGRYEAALRLHVAHLLVRAFCSSCVGLYDLPMSVAFFGGVSVDSAMRKEPKDECFTPSNPHGLSRGHGVPPGEYLDIYATLIKVQGRYTLAPTQKKLSQPSQEN